MTWQLPPSFPQQRRATTKQPAAARHRQTFKRRANARTNLGGLELALLLPAQRLESIYLPRAVRLQLQQLAAAARRALQLLT